MSRAEHRRREYARRKGRLDVDEQRHLNAARRIPDDHPSAVTAAPTYTDPHRARRYLGVLRRSGVADELQRRLGAHPGPKSRLSVEAVLLAVLLAADEKKNYLRSDVCAVLNGFDATIAYTLGLCDEVTWRPVSYHTTQKQLRRLELAVRDGWTSDCGEGRDLAWVTRALLDATIPRDQRRSITAVALDSTFVETWAVTRDFTPDAVAQHRLASREIPDLPEPDPQRPEGSDAIGTIGLDGRLIRGADHDARPGHRSATSKRPASLGLGYDFHVAVAVRSAHWSGDPARLTLADRPAAYICALAFVAASTNPGPVGREVIEETIRHAPNLQEVVADRGYTAKRASFVRRLRERGLDVVMDYSSTEVERPKAVTAGRQQQPIINHCGTLLPSWVPEALHSPPDGTEPQQRTDFYDQRSRWRYSPHQRLRDGSIQMRCPQCAGRVKTNARTRNPRQRRAGGSVPYLAGITTEHCCDGLVTLNSTQLANYQNVPYGTTAWKHSYGRRNQIENTNSRLRHKGALLAGTCRSLSRTPRAIAALAQAVIYNLALSAKTEPADAHTPPQTPQKPQLSGSEPDPHTDTTPATGRAPP